MQISTPQNSNPFVDQHEILHSLVSWRDLRMRHVSIVEIRLLGGAWHTFLVICQLLTSLLVSTPSNDQKRLSAIHVTSRYACKKRVNNRE